MAASPPHELTTARPSTRRFTVGAASVVFFVFLGLASLTVYGLAYTTMGKAWEDAVSFGVAPLDAGVWRFMRGGLAYLAVPAALVVFVGAVSWAFRRRDKQAACAAVILVVGANVTMQAMKHSLLPILPPAQRAISGHVCIAAATCLGVLLVVPLRARRAAVVFSWALLSAVSVAIVLTRWHTLGQVLLPLFSCATLAVSVYAVLGWLVRLQPLDAAHSFAPTSGVGTSGLLAGGGVLGLVLAWLAATVGPAEWLAQSGVVLALSLAVVISAAAVCIGLSSVLLPISSVASPPTTPAPPNVSNVSLGDQASH
ncbi:MAG: hypothetical protein ACOYBY_11560 [Dermatophilaceae bacterium]